VAGMRWPKEAPRDGRGLRLPALRVAVGILFMARRWVAHVQSRHRGRRDKAPVGRAAGQLPRAGGGWQLMAQPRALTRQQVEALRKVGRSASEMFVWIMDDEPNVESLRRRLGQVAGMLAEVCEVLAGQVWTD